MQVLQADGGNYSASVNAATLALIDAGIPLKEYVISCTASLANGNIPLVDISHLEESSGGPTLTIAALPLSGKVSFVLNLKQLRHIKIQNFSLQLYTSVINSLLLLNFR